MLLLVLHIIFEAARYLKNRLQRPNAPIFLRFRVIILRVSVDFIDFFILRVCVCVYF